MVEKAKTGIWKTLHESQGHTDMCYVETPTNPNYATTVKLWNEIKADVAAYKKTLHLLMEIMKWMQESQLL